MKNLTNFYKKKKKLSLLTRSYNYTQLYFYFCFNSTGMDPSLKGNSSTHFGREITYHLSNMASYFLFLIFNRTQAGRREGTKLRQHVQVHKARCIVRSPWKGTMREARANFNRLSYSTWESRMREASSFSRGRDQHVPLSLTLSFSLSFSLDFKSSISRVSPFFSSHSLLRSHLPYELPDENNSFADNCLDSFRDLLEMADWQIRLGMLISTHVIQLFALLSNYYVSNYY